MISIIVAVARNGVIGGGNTLLWHISEDLKRFKALTTGHPVVKGRKTFASLGRPLPNRPNVVVTRQHLAIPGCTVAGSLEAARALFPAVRRPPRSRAQAASPRSARPPLRSAAHSKRMHRTDLSI